MRQLLLDIHVLRVGVSPGFSSPAHDFESRVQNLPARFPKYNKLIIVLTKWAWKFINIVHYYDQNINIKKQICSLYCFSVSFIRSTNP